MSEELLPCPFCSSTNIVRISENIKVFPTFFQISCIACTANINSPISDEKAIEKWNQRA